jgi:serine/threonine protein kinase/Tol biopolymer transport system component
MALTSGTRLGPYEIQSPLGAGGMGEVYRARDTRLERTVAIKVLPTHLSSNPDLKARFEREAKTISSLSHPHICTLHDVGHQDGIDFLVMEYVEGETLADRLQKGALPLKQALEFGIQMADALEKAHRQGIIHRDLKPANIMLTKAGAKLLDFGLAKPTVPAIGAVATSSGGKLTPSTPTMSVAALVSPAAGVTQQGTILGTFQYMAPEVLQGQEADAQSDLFSFGCVLYEMVTGRRAFPGKSQLSVLTAILEKDPEPVTAARPGTPVALEHTIQTCLEKNPDDRFQAAHDLRLQLQWIAKDGSRPTEQASSLSKPAKLRFLLVGLMLLLAVAIVIRVESSLPLPRIVDANQITDDGVQKSGVYITGIVPAPMLTDGSRLYFPELLGGKYPLTQVSVNGGETVPLSTPFANPGPSDISPNGAEILIFPFVAAEPQEQLWSLPLPAGSPRRVGNVSAQDAAWSADGNHIVYSLQHDIFFCKADGSECRKFATAPGSPAWMRWSPDGKMLRFTSYDSKTVSASLWEVSADGSNLHPLLPSWSGGSACCGGWTPDGRYFVFQAMHNGRSDIWAIRERAGWPRKAVATQLTAGPLSFITPVPSRDGNKLYVLGIRSRGELVRYDEKSKEFVPFLGGLSAEGVTFSKDGKQVAYTAYPQGTLWRASPDGTGKLQLTFAPMQAVHPRWSPDGQKLVFSATVPGEPSKIYTVAASGGSPEPITSLDTNAVSPDWSPQGDAIIYGGFEGSVTPDFSRQPLRIVYLKSQQASAVPGSEGLMCPRWSPDGRYIAAATNGEDKTMLFDFASKQWRELADFPVSCPVWSTDNQFLYLRKTNGEAPGVFRVRMSDRKIEPVTDLRGFRGSSEYQGGNWLDLAPDNSPLLLRDRGSEEIYALEWQLP